MYCTVKCTYIHGTVYIIQFLAASKKIYEIAKFYELKFVKAPVFVFHILAFCHLFFYPNNVNLRLFKIL